MRALGPIGTASKPIEVIRDHICDADHWLIWLTWFATLKPVAESSQSHDECPRLLATTMATVSPERISRAAERQSSIIPEADATRMTMVMIVDEIEEAYSPGG